MRSGEPEADNGHYTPIESASFTAKSAMASAASRVLAAAMKRPLWQKLAPSMPQTASSSPLARPA